jgi:hypothetical protein
LLAIVAALMLAVPGALSLGTTHKASAAPILSNGQGDVCGVWVSEGNKTSGNPQIPVGDHFWALARLQDSFFLPLSLQAFGFGSTNGVFTDGTSEPFLAGQYIVFPSLNGDPDVIPFYLSASVDSQTGEAKIIDRIEDHAISNFAPDLRFPFIGLNGVSWTWPSIIDVVQEFGDAEENDISPVDTVNALDVLTELAGEGGDNDPVNSDIQEFFVNKAVTAQDETVDKNALNNCGLPILSGNASITAANMASIFNDMVQCFTTIGFDAGACNDLAIQLGLNCSIGATIGCSSVIKDVNVNLDGWSEISLMCTKPGEVKITFDPTTWFDREGNFSPSHNEGRSIDIECIGPASSASATANGSPATVEIKPVGTSVSLSTIVVTVLDSNGKRLDNATVTFTTNDCNLGTSSTGPFSGQSVTTTSDTDSTSDLSFVSSNSQAGGQLGAGTAEAYLQCNVSGATPGTATITWVVNGQIGPNGVVSSGLSGTVTVKVVGPPSALKLDVSPATSTCGNPVVATATVTDAAGQSVSDGTQVFFTTTTATGVQGGSEGAQGVGTTVNGVASVTLSIDPMDGGTHTVSARTGGNDLTGAAVAVVSQSTTINCSAVAAAAPAAPATITAPRTGTGPSIVPPNTGDAGLAASSSTSFGLYALAGVVALALVGVASLRFATRR